jgi:glycosyltransferase involved in cell wall biosynthesis
MSRRKKHKQEQGQLTQAKLAPETLKIDGFAILQQRARELVCRGDVDEAQRLYEVLRPSFTDPHSRARLLNDCAFIEAARGNLADAAKGFTEALAADPKYQLARDNLALVQEDLDEERAQAEAIRTAEAHRPAAPRVAVVSFLFNWPSHGGGNVHTAELVRFLTKAGYGVRHFFARYEPWQVGNVQEDSALRAALAFDTAQWNIEAIKQRFRAAVDGFQPDFVLITDCWNFKPHLVVAMTGYPVLLRFQALECLCPLNNVRLLPLGAGRWGQCPRNQLATPAVCADCLAQRGQFSGPLHQQERALSGVGTPEYHALLLESLVQAEVVLVFNPLVEAMLSPYARRVQVVPWGMDPDRFSGDLPDVASHPGPLVIFQAGVVDEPMKGFAVLHEACARLWQKRQDFHLVATGAPPGRVDDFTTFTGWLSQEQLAKQYTEVDLVVVPTLAQEGLSRTSVEAMAAKRPVLASRIGGLPWTVADGATGLLFEPGNVADLAQKLDTLLSSPELCRRLGTAGRQRFESDFAWPVVIERHYRPLLTKKK